MEQHKNSQDCEGKKQISTVATFSNSSSKSWLSLFIKTILAIRIQIMRLFRKSQMERSIQ
ncbi:hypothetical protein H5410_012187 [Solanum commersonii]|uniref:Uncharacterized protein n=1 Tax=Solanum commersonii TaxID=4109 RepID=A0A9J6ARQ6_SOLCO|nr:hypothetical protein H5410_012187 [Solanum commersonii]